VLRTKTFPILHTSYFILHTIYLPIRHYAMPMLSLAPTEYCVVSVGDQSRPGPDRPRSTLYLIIHPRWPGPGRVGPLPAARARRGADLRAARAAAATDLPKLTRQRRSLSELWGKGSSQKFASLGNRTGDRLRPPSPSAASRVQWLRAPPPPPSSSSSDRQCPTDSSSEVILGAPPPLTTDLPNLTKLPK